MATRKFKETLREKVGEFERDYYSNPGDAFCHWGLKTYFELDEDDAVEACDVSGSGDRGLDAFWVDEEQRRVLIVQAKYSARGRSFGADLVAQLEHTYGWFVRLGEEDPADIRRQVRTAARTFTSLRKNDPEHAVELVCLASGSFTKEAENQAKAFNDEHGDEGVQLVLVGIDDLEEVYNEQLSRLKEPPVEVKLDLAKFFAFEPAGEPKTIVASINVAELAAIERKYHYRIFQKNVRYFLKASNRVNKGIVNTLSDPDTRGRFWYYNNGIAIVCDSVDVEEVERRDDAVGIATIENLQIVNGCQTTTTLGDMADDIEDDGAPAYVLVRIIEAADAGLQAEISRYNNRQSAVKDRDLMSNDDPQQRLEKEFEQRDPPWFYERKRGQWDAEAKNSATLRDKFGKRRIDNEVAAQAAYAFWHDPAVAKARKRMLFVRKLDDAKGLYEQIFTESTTTDWMLLPYLTQRYVASRKATYMRELKVALQVKEPDVKTKRTVEREWLKFSDQMVLAAIHFYWQQHVDLESGASQRALLDDANFGPAVKAAYGLAVRDLGRFFRSKRVGAEKRDEPFNPANFVKGNWSEALAWLEDQVKVHEDDDAFEDIPAFGP